ncbi:MAG: mechanosensitive ion channel family protein [Candidatus Bathyarchaeia archaeon]
MDRLKKRLWILIFATTALSIWYYGLEFSHIIETYLPLAYADHFVRLVLLVVGLSLLYEVSSVMLRYATAKVKAGEGEATMILGLVKFSFILVGLILIISNWFSLGTVGSMFAAFGGLILGWSLQAPVSGFAAWLLISIIRPFRVGDRIQLPSYGLVGDVVGISPLYTTLNQVGGSVGSEEPANRTILIPNAMLFSALLINYTPKHQERLIKFEAHRPSTGPAYMLDEFVLRMSYDSDWNEAERILLNAARDVTADIIKATGQEPYIRADMSDWYGVYMRLRFMTISTERPKIMYELTKRIYRDIQASEKVDIAIPYVYSFKKGLRLTGSLLDPTLVHNSPMNAPFNGISNLGIDIKKSQLNNQREDPTITLDEKSLEK